MKKFKYAIVFLALSGVVSCSEFLSEQNPTKYSIDYIFSTPEGIKLAVNSLYSKFRDILGDSSENSIWVAQIRGTDLVTTNGGTGNFFGIYDPNYVKPSASQVDFLWKNMYSIIGSCNEILNAASLMEQTDEVKTAVAEASCFRAYCYLYLYRVFDRIWLNTEATTPENLNNEHTFYPASQSEVFDLIYSDLDTAIGILGWKSYQPGRWNQAAARHLLAKSALWIKDWKTALEQVDAIDQSKEYYLMDVDKVFAGAKLNHDESLW